MTTLTFLNPATFTTGSQPASVIAVDLNGDGALDLVTANYNTSDVSVLLGNGSGGFAAATTLSPGAFTPIQVIAADLNNDGKLDLVTANTTANNVSVFLGNGSGGFGAATPFGSSVTGVINPFVVVAVDLNGDGKLDLAIADYGSNTVSIMLGDGSGGFATPTSIALGTTTFDSIATADLNGDGKADLVASNNYTGNYVSVLLGNGSGGFATPTTLATGLSPRGVAIGDVNSDGKLDVVVADYGSNSVSVLLGNGSGGFSAKTDYTVGNGPVQVVLADLNKDGNLDIVAGISGITFVSGATVGGGVAVLKGSSSGVFGAPTTYLPGRSVYGVAVGDLNGDTGPDIIATTTGGSGSTVVAAFNNLACYAEGTRIRTERGDIAIELLTVGDHVLTVSGASRPIVWLGKRGIDLARHPHPQAVLPVLVCADAFGAGMPARDLLLSPEHAVFTHGVLIPVRDLINGARSPTGISSSTAMM